MDVGMRQAWNQLPEPYGEQSLRRKTGAPGQPRQFDMTRTLPTSKSLPKSFLSQFSETHPSSEPSIISWRYVARVLLEANEIQSSARDQVHSLGCAAYSK